MWEKSHSIIQVPKECLAGPKNWLIDLKTPPELKISEDGSKRWFAQGAIINGNCLDSNQLLPINAAITLPDGSYPRHGQLAVFGRLTKNHSNHNFHVFNFSHEAETKAIHYRITASSVAIASLPGGPINYLDAKLQKLAAFRHSYGDLLLTSAPTTASGQIAQAMILGLREQQNVSLRTRHAKAGTSHLLAISGLHVGFAMSLVYFLFKLLFALFFISPRWPAQKLAALATIIILGIYVIFTGASWSTIRAGIMAFMIFSATLFGQNSTGLNNIACAALAILLWEPSTIYSPGFLLSFTAAVSLLLSRPLLIWWPWTKASLAGKIAHYFWQLLVVSLVCTISTAPLCSYFFQSTSLIGPFTSIICIPLAALVVAFGTLGCLIFPLIPPVAHFAAIVSDYICAIIDEIAITTSTWPIPNFFYIFTPLGIILFYSTIFLLLHIRKPICRYLGLSSGILLFIYFILNLQQSFHPNPTINILDVGQGDAILITLPDSKRILIDGGGAPNPNSNFDVGKRLTVPALKGLGVQKINVVIVTHGHPDHLGGLFAVVENFEISQLIYNGTESSLQNSLLVEAKNHGIDIHEAPFGISRLLQGPGYDLQLYRMEDEQAEDLAENNHSLLLKAIIYGHSFLFTGDNEIPAEEIFINHLPPSFLQADFLKIAHHGSKTATSKDWLIAVKPQTAFISVGYNNSFGLPNSEVLDLLQEQGVTIFRTDYLGAIQVEIDRHGSQIIKQAAQN